MNSQACNCVVCAEEFNLDDLHNLSLSKINITKFKICQACLDKADPADDYIQVRKILNSYIKISEAKQMFLEAEDILKFIK